MELDPPSPLEVLQSLAAKAWSDLPHLELSSPMGIAHGETSPACQVWYRTEDRVLVAGFPVGDDYWFEEVPWPAGWPDVLGFDWPSGEMTGRAHTDDWHAVLAQNGTAEAWAASSARITITRP